MSGPELITLGCRLNIAESEAMRTLAGGQDDLVIVNSCAVTAEAVRNTRQAIRKARRSRPDARIWVTGCAAEIAPKDFRAMPEVDAVLGQQAKLAPASYSGDGVPSPVERPAPFIRHARAFVEVQNGCDHRCTFCIIPFGRGESRSVPLDLAVDRIRALVDAGHREVVLTGVDVTSYGHDLPGQPSLGALVHAILNRVPDLPRLRLSSLDSVEIDPQLFDLITGQERLMPHLHLSLQAGDDMILKRMKRRHSRAQAIEMVRAIKAKRPEVAIGADIIAGFPTETDAMFENSLKLVEECDIVHGHIFPYSPREGTPAARMPQLDRAIISDRAARLRAACVARRAAWLAAHVGTRQRILVELNGRQGHSPSFAPVAIPETWNARGGQIYEVQVNAVENGLLIAGEAA